MAFLVKLENTIHDGLQPAVVDKTGQLGQLHHVVLARQALAEAAASGKERVLYFFAKEMKTDVEVHGEGDESLYDPKARAKVAEPYRPAIFVE